MTVQELEVGQEYHLHCRRTLYPSKDYEVYSSASPITNRYHVVVRTGSEKRVRLIFLHQTHHRIPRRDMRYHSKPWRQYTTYDFLSAGKLVRLCGKNIKYITRKCTHGDCCLPNADEFLS